MRITTGSGSGQERSYLFLGRGISPKRSSKILDTEMPIWNERLLSSSSETSVALRPI